MKKIARTIGKEYQRNGFKTNGIGCIDEYHCACGNEWENEYNTSPISTSKSTTGFGAELMDIYALYKLTDKLANKIKATNSVDIERMNFHSSRKVELVYHYWEPGIVMKFNTLEAFFEYLEERLDDH